MKSSLLLLLLLGLCLDCNTAENAPSTKNNYFSINGIKYAITDAALLDVDTPGGILSAPYVHTLVFTTAKIKMMRDNNDYFNLSGSGPVMGVVCYTQGSGLESGNYFVALRSPNKPKDIGLGFFAKDWETAQRGENYWQAAGTVLQAGKMTVTENNSQWQLNANLVGDDNSAITLDYTGNFKNFLFRYIPPSTTPTP